MAPTAPRVAAQADASAANTLCRFSTVAKSSRATLRCGQSEHFAQSSLCARAHGECSVRDRHKRTVGFIESAMPADGIPRCPFTSHGDVGTSRLEEQFQKILHDHTPIPKTSYWPGRGTSNSAKTSDLGSQSGQIEKHSARAEVFRSFLKNGRGLARCVFRLPDGFVSTKMAPKCARRPSKIC